MSFRDPWPTMPDGHDFDGQNLLTLVRHGNSPFHDKWDVNLLIREIEENLCAQVIDIPYVSGGSNNYGIHLKLSNGMDVVARLARGDVNMPDYDGFPIHVQVPEVKFESEVYELLRSEPDIVASHLLYYRLPVQHEGPRLDRPKDIAGRRLLVFRRAEGENNVWDTLDPAQKSCLLSQAAHIRASLYKFQIPPAFASAWLRARLFEQKPELFPIPVAPTREFCVALFTSKIEATIKGIGDMIGWEDDHNTVGPVAAAAKQSLLRLIPHIMPAGDDEKVLYRFVLEHDDFGIHNMLTAMDANSQPLATSLFDWETGCIVPAILSDPSMAVTADLVVGEDAEPALRRLSRTVTVDEMAQMVTWPRQYFEALFLDAPDYKRAIRAGKDARHLWFALRDWRGEVPEDYFGNLGIWAEKRLKELGVSQGDD
ncbi:3-hydroxybutyryl-CoA dehydratase [Chaetomium fimeti]|uniref:3-hydroxybutyryl-CoA dehydratase n=1 Tax=Chaetomium fimeti TaxID=1854472 RepID=A0AAE0H5J6_9PEZI|nr:3-hydroxybutyryl-CoA dehydratase [Chaetomium fimeti]